MGPEETYTSLDELPALADGDIITLTGNVTCIQPFTVNKDNITLNVGTHTLKFNLGSSADDGAIMVSGDNFEINGETGGLIEVTGDCVRGIYTGSDGKTITVNTDIKINGGTSIGGFGVGIYVYGDSEAIINGKITVTGGIGGSGYGVEAYDGTVRVNKDITVNGYEAYGICASDDANVIVTGDITVTGNDKVYGAYAAGGTITVNGSITTDGTNSYGIATNGDDSKAFVTGDITVTGNKGTGGDAVGIFTQDSDVIIEVDGNVTVTGVSSNSPTYLAGVFADNSGISVIVGKDVTFIGSRGCGVYAGGGASVTVEGNVEVNGSICRGVYAWSGASVTVEGNIEVDGVTGQGAVQAVSGADITVFGNVTSSSGTGVLAQSSSSVVTVKGNVTANGSTSYGANASGNAKITVNGNVTSGYGVHAATGGNVTIEGKFIVPEGNTAVTLNDNSIILKFPDDAVPVPGTDAYADYLVYTNGHSYVWVRIWFAVTVNGGTGSGNFKADDTVNISATVPMGKVFNAWTATGVTLTSPNSADTSFTMPAGPVTFTANLSDIVYTISYAQGTGSGVSGSVGPSTKTYDVTLVLEIATFTRNGYEQTGWSVNSNGSTNDYALGDNYTDNAATTLYPVWTPVYEVIINNGTGSGTYKVGDTVNISATVPAGKEFDSWTGLGVTLPTGATTSFTMPGGNVTLTANFVDATYTIAYAQGTGSGISGSVSSSTKTHGMTLVLETATFARTGYTQTGWATSDGGAKVYDMGGNYTNNAATTLYPVWTPTYTVTVTGGSGSGNYKAGDVVNISPTVPADKVFSTWTATGVTLTSPNSANTSFTMPASNVTLTANFVDATYGIDLNPESKDFGTSTIGYLAFTPFVVTVSNTGNAPTGTLTVALTGDDAGSFVLDYNSITSISAGSSNSFIVRPAHGLEIGEYTATVTITGTNGISATFPVSFTVEPVKYHLNVVDGTGSGYYEPGTVVNLTANEAPEGKIFHIWYSYSGGVFANDRDAETTFTMPANNVSLEARYATPSSDEIDIVLIAVIAIAVIGAIGAAVWFFFLRK